MEVDNTYFPINDFLSFSQVPKFEGMIKKLKEFNAEVDNDLKVAEEKLERLPALCSSGKVRI